MQIRLCDSTYLEEAKNQGIFFLSSITAVADEVGWDFISLVMKSISNTDSVCQWRIIKV